MSDRPVLSAGSYVPPAWVASVTVTTGCLCCSTISTSTPPGSRPFTNAGNCVGRSGAGAGGVVGY